MPTTTRAARIARVTTHFRDRRTDASRLTTAQDLAALVADGMTYRSIVADVTARDGESTISIKTISLYLAALKDAGDEPTPESFGAAYRDRHHASRTPKPKAEPKAEPKAKSDTVTPGNDVTTPNVVEVKNAATAIAAFEALMRTVESLPARDRQRVTAHITRAMSRRFTKAA